MAESAHFRVTRNTQYVFFSRRGGGGVEISHTLTTVYHGIIHTLREVGQDPSQISVFLTSTTGTAAFNIRDQP